MTNAGSSNNTTEVLVRVASTPNPNAWKFILDRPVLNEGKFTFESVEECENVPLAATIMQIPGVKQVHFFANVITVTHFEDLLEVEELKKDIVAVIKTRMAIHNPNFNSVEAKKKSRDHLSPEVQKIEEILDRTVRPGLQGDGGDIEVVKYEDKKLYVYYQGACGTCPSATQGTLMAIEGILKNEFEPNIEVIPV